MSLWDEVRHHYEEYEEQKPPSFERKDQHTAQKFHHCESCEGNIQPGERYNKYVWRDDDGFQMVKTHTDAEECAAMRRQVEAWEAQEDARRAAWNAEFLAYDDPVGGEDE